MLAEENYQSSFDSQLCGEHSVIDDCDNVRGRRNKEINKVRDMLQRTDEIMQQKFTKKAWDNNISNNKPIGRVTSKRTRQQKGTATRKKSQLLIHFISNLYL